MNRPTDPEEVAALAVLDALGRHEGPEETRVPEPEDEVEEVLRRLHGEAVGRLPYALPFETPDPVLKERLMALVLGDQTQEVVPGSTSADSAAASPPEPESPAVVDRRPLEMPDELLPMAASPRYAAARRPRRGVRFLLAAAALIAVAGLGLWVAYLQSELAAGQARFTFAERQWKSELEQTRQALSVVSSRYQIATAPAVTVFPLRGPTGFGPAAAASAYLYVAPDHQHWDFQVHNLTAEPQGHDYQIWFLVGDQPHSAGCFNIEQGRPVFKMLAPMPQGMTGVAVTLEPRGGSPRPTTPMLLVNREPVRL